MNEEVATSHYLVVSVIGTHAGEDLAAIFFRKKEDIKRTGKTYWLIQSHKAKTNLIQEICKKADLKNSSVYCLFIEPSYRGGAKPTLKNDLVTSVSSDNQNWEPVPKDIKITGKVSKISTALVFDQLEVFDKPIIFDLWEYSEFSTKNPIKMMLGASTVCCERVFSQGVKSRYRNAIGFGRLTAPYGLWLR